MTLFNLISSLGDLIELPYPFVIHGGLTTVPDAIKKNYNSEELSFMESSLEIEKMMI